MPHWDELKILLKVPFSAKLNFDAAAEYEDDEIKYYVRAQ